MAFSLQCTDGRIYYRLANVMILVFVSVFLFSSIGKVDGVRMMTRQLNLTFEMGRDATLTCTVRSIGRRRVIWRKLSEPFPLTVGTTRFWPGKKYRVKRNGDDWKLTIKNVQYSDAGEYECRVSGFDGVADILSLIIPASGKTHLLPTETTISATLGSTVILPCHVKNRHKSLILWQNEEGHVVALRKKTYSGDKRHKVLHTERTQWSLQIRNVKPEDLGVYTCVVNTSPFLTRTVTLREGRSGKDKETLDKVPEIGQSIGTSPQLVRETFRGDVQVKQYQSVTLTCQFTGDPAPTIKWERRMWTRDGVKVVEDLETQGETYMLTNAQPEDTGVYVCRASNGSPPPEQGLIRVKVKEVITTTTPLPTTTTFDPIDDAAPRVYSFEEKVYQQMGRDAELTCKAVGIPRPQVHWIVGGTHIKDDYKFTIRNQQYRHHTLHSTLLVKSVHPGNFGKYECYAYNKYGDDRTTIELAQSQNS